MKNSKFTISKVSNTFPSFELILLAFNYLCDFIVFCS